MPILRIPSPREFNRSKTNVISPLLAHWRDLKKKGKLSAGDFERVVTWLDVYGQYAGQFSEEQERDLERLKAEWTRQGIIEAATEKTKLAAK